ALGQFDTSIQGLLESDAETRLDEHGRNTVVSETRKSFLHQLLSRLANPLNLLLLILSGMSLFIGDLDAALIIFSMVVLSVGLSWFQESRSNDAAEKLNEMVETTIEVLRREELEHADEDPAGEDDPEQETRPQTKPVRKLVPLDELVPGDLVQLSAGDMIPADVRLLSAKDLFINQAALTGESMPVEKAAAMWEQDGSNPLEVGNLCFMGTNVVSGTAIALVVMTGKQTYFGSLARTLGEDRVQTSFDRGINRFTWLMIRFMLVMAPLVFLINGLSKGDWLEAFLFALSVAVGLTPEMLPVIVTTNLAKGALAMSRKKVIVKRLNSIQNFGAMDVLCTD
ncbi:MAG: cation-transporting P-type ATPase, partial [Gammaproteobacteria bacterium]